MSSQLLKIPACYMRGGTSKGVFFKLSDLPDFAQQPRPQRDAFLLRVIGSPDPYAKHTDGMGGATSSTSKIVIVSPSDKSDHDVDYLFGQVSIEKAQIDWGGNCGNLSAAVGSFAIQSQLIAIPADFDGSTQVKIWQTNIQKTILANIPICQGEVLEVGDFYLDGVTFPAAEIKLAFVDPADANGEMFPTGNVLDKLEVPGIGAFDVTMINAGIPTLFFNAKDLGFSGTELQTDINQNQAALARLEEIRTAGALAMGLIQSPDELAQHIPKLAFVSPARSYISSSGKQVEADDIDVNVRALSMGKLHHAMMGTAAVAIGTAAVIRGTLVNLACRNKDDKQVTFGHPSGTLTVGAEVALENGKWVAKKALMSRSARVLMEGRVRVPNLLNLK